jgi:hypothetical protein
MVLRALLAGKEGPEVLLAQDGRRARARGDRMRRGAWMLDRMGACEG